MTQEQYTARQRKFQHLTREKRAQIEILLRQGVPKAQIARAVGISRSTLYNELNRRTVEQIDAKRKTEKTAVRRLSLWKLITSCAMRRSRFLKTRCHRTHFVERKKLSGRFKETVSIKTLCRYIDKRIWKVRNIDLPLKVNRKGHTDKRKQNKRLFGMSIEERVD